MTAKSANYKARFFWPGRVKRDGVGGEKPRKMAICQQLFPSELPGFRVCASVGNFAHISSPQHSNAASIPALDRGFGLDRDGIFLHLRVSLKINFPLLDRDRFLLSK